MATAKAVKAAGATALRGGAFKPRTSPYSFQGLEGRRAENVGRGPRRDRAGGRDRSRGDRGRGTGRPLCRRAASGARNMQNIACWKRSAAVDRPVLLKRGPSATLEELLLAAEYILNGGNRNVMLCERGIRTFESTHALHAAFGHGGLSARPNALPVVVDPSHGTGHTYLVPQMAAASVAAGADGLILEVHPQPEKALSDGYQSLTFPQFEQTMELCRKVAGASGQEDVRGFVAPAGSKGASASLRDRSRRVPRFPTCKNRAGCIGNVSWPFWPAC